MCGYHSRLHRLDQRAERTMAPSAVATLDPDRPVRDEQREAAVEQLRRNVGVGRLGLDDFESRVERAWHASTAGELAAVLEGLERVSSAGERRRARRRAVTPFVAVMAMLVAIWLVVGLTAGFGFPWFVWPMLGWGIPVALANRREPGQRRRAAGSLMEGGV